MDYRYDKDGKLVAAEGPKVGPLGELASGISDAFSGLLKFDPAPDASGFDLSPVVPGSREAAAERQRLMAAPPAFPAEMAEELARTQRAVSRASKGLGPVPYEPVVPPVVPNALQSPGQVSLGNDAALKDADALKLTLDQLSKSGTPAASVVEGVVRRLGGSGSLWDFYENIAQRAKDRLSYVSEKGVTQDTSGALGQIAQTYGAIQPPPGVDARWKDSMRDPNHKPWEQVGPVEQVRALKANAVIDSAPGATKFQKTMNYLNDEGLGFTAQWAAAELLKGNYQPPEWSEKPAPTTQIIQEFLKAGGTLVMAGDSPEAVRNRALLQNLAHGVEDERAKARAAERLKGGATGPASASASPRPNRPLTAVGAAKAEAQSNLTFTQQEQQLKLKQRQAEIDKTVLQSQELGIKIRSDLQDLIDKPNRTARENTKLDLLIQGHNLQVAKFAQQTLQDNERNENAKETLRLAQERFALEAGKGPAGVEKAAKDEALKLSMLWEKNLAASEKAASEAESMKAPVPPNEAAKAAARELGLDPSKPEELAKLALPSTWEKHLKGKVAGGGAAPAATQPAAAPATQPASETPNPSVVKDGTYYPVSPGMKLVEGQHYILSDGTAVTWTNGKPVYEAKATAEFRAREKK